MPASIRAVVFDLDGLMFDTEALYFRVSSEMVAARGKTFTPEIMRAMIGRRSVEAGYMLKTMTGLNEPLDVLLADVRQRFYAEMETAVHPTPGLFHLLDRLGHHGLPLAVATSSRRSYAAQLLGQHRLLDRFRFVLGSEDVAHGKPDPEIYLTAIERFDVPPRSVLVLEDSPAGVASGRAAGTYVVGVPHEHSPAQALQSADLIVQRLDDPGLLGLFDHQS
ncbi:MAG TPA: HAD family phosphatase [Isosphaeraceae bacterium]|nr:HAD family phosphatase [Isosphaeraceae bacterium]